MLKYIKFIGCIVVLSCLVLSGGSAVAATVGQWNMNEGAGNIAADSSGNGYDFINIGTSTGSEYSWISPGQGGSGSAVSAPNPNNSYLMALIDVNEISYKLTVEAWIKPTGKDTGGSMIVSLYDGFFMSFHGSIDMMRFVIYTPSAIWGDWLDLNVEGAQAALFDGQWHHVVGVYDGIPDENGNLNVGMFWDGQLVGRRVVASAVPVHIGPNGATGENLFIGTHAWNPSGNTENYVGAIDNVRISNAVDYNVPAAGDVVGLWHMDEGSGNIIHDSTGYLNHMTKGTDYTWKTGSNGYINGCLSAPNDSVTFCRVNSKAALYRYQVTAEAWIKPTKIGFDGSYILGQYWGWGLQFHGTLNMMRMVACLNVPGVPGDTWFTADTAAPWDVNSLFNGQWHHVAGTYNGIPDDSNQIRVKLYWDGALVAESNLFSTVSVPMNAAMANDIYIGTTPFTPGAVNQFYHGDIDEVKITDKDIYSNPCGGWGYLPSDINKDCHVDFRDFAELARNWLTCTDPYNVICN